MAVVADDEPKLSRDYGFDISMHEKNMAVSTSAIKDFQKKVAILYNDFIKTMNGHLRDEKEVRKVFNQLRKEKLLNSQYSLYRSDGADLFSKATENRSKLMENFVRMSPVVLDDFRNYTPWGLDMIIDEDLILPSEIADTEIRPLTAPAISVPQAPQEEEVKEQQEEPRPQTVFPLPCIKDVYTMLKSEADSKTAETTQEPKHEIKSAHWKSLKAAVDQKEEELPEEDLEIGIDGHVDMKLDQTKARKIMIRAKAFDDLSKGCARVRLKEKSGEFILKPAPVTQQMDVVQAYFMAKDPSKEQMALVRKRTSHFSPTVSSDMKINNKIPIMKSLLGHKVKKTSVSEIMSDARNRKTKQYKVVLRNYKQVSADQDNKSQSNDNTRNNSPRIHSSQHSPRNDGQNANVVDDAILSEKNLKRQLHQDLEKHNMELLQNRIKVVMEAWGKNESPRPPSVTIKTDLAPKTSPSEPVFRPRVYSDKSLSSSHHRVKFIDENNQTQPNRSTSSMSFREPNENFVDPMRLIADHQRPESRSESSLSFATGYGSLGRLSRRSKTHSRRFPNRNTPVSSDSYSELSIDAPAKFLSSRDAHKMVKEQMKRDKEKENALFSLRRRMATAKR